MKIHSFSVIIPALAVLLSCSGNSRELQPDPKPQPDPEPTPVVDYKSPGTPKLNVVAHRGGSSECGYPDNSRASLQYAISLKCYASECDIYWTKDNNVIVAHADGNCKINGFHPWEATVDEIRAKGKLSNGESVPTLDEFIDLVMTDGSCTKLWLDIKNITVPSTLTDYPINAAKRACEVIEAKKAKNFCEFICTGNATVWKSAVVYSTKVGCNNGWMANKGPDGHKENGSGWANMSTENMTPNGSKYTVKQFKDAGLAISVYNVDKSSDATVIDYYVSNYNDMKAICTNYPSWLMTKLSK